MKFRHPRPHGRNRLLAIAMGGGLLLVLGLAQPASPRGVQQSAARAPDSVAALFFGDTFLIEPLVSRSEDQIDFDWGSDAPDPGVPADGFAVRFQAYFRPVESGPHRFITESDDGVILFLDDLQLIEDWTRHSLAERSSAPITLTAGISYPLELYYFDAVGDAVVRLFVEAPDGRRILVPADQFLAPDAAFPARDPAAFNFAHYDASGNLVVYDDTLATNWHDWSWASVDRNYTATVHSGDRSILVDLDGYAAFCPFFSNGQNWADSSYRGLSTRELDSLSFWVHRGLSAGGQTVGVQTSDILAGWEWQHRASFTVPEDDLWQQIVIPLSDLDGRDTQLTRLAWIGNGTQVDPILLDDIRLLRAGEPAPLARDPISAGDACWLFRDQRNANLSTSWNVEVIRQSDQASSGVFGLAARFRWYGGLQFRSLDSSWNNPQPFDLGTANVLRFDVNRGADDRPEQRYHLYGLDENGEVSFKAPLEDYLDAAAIDLDPATWQGVTAPLHHLLGGQDALYGVGIQEMDGVDGFTEDFLYLDEVRFEYRTPAADLGIYRDELAAGWTAGGSWDASVDLAAPAPVLSGTASLAVTHTAAWGGLYLHAGEAVDARDYRTLRFWIHGGSSGSQAIQLWTQDAGYNQSSSVALAEPAAGAWQQVDVPLSELGNPATIRAISWQEAGGNAQPTFYLDEIWLTGEAPEPPAPQPGPVLVVDAGAQRRPISPDIYGMNFADEQLAAELRLPVRRWGGNATTRYNWQNDTSNRASDWFFENIPNDNANPGDLPDGSASDQFVEQNRRTGTRSLLTIPMIGWTPKARQIDCGFSVSLYGPQQQTDPWRPDCGNGVASSGSYITGNDPTDTSVAITTTFVQDWIAHLIGRYGPAEEGGVALYNLDNEPMLWNHTHRDVHPGAVGYDELSTLTASYAAAVKAADPGALTLGPALWGWTAYFYSALDQVGGGAWWNDPPDRNAHDGIAFVPWYLQQMQTYEQQQGQRILDYLDLHYYPQAAGVALSGAGDAETQARRLRSTRSLWDPTYTDESWINEPVMLIPRMKAWVEENYPGTKLAVTEYNWGALDHINGALAQADVLGIFGREGLDLATLWSPPEIDDPGAFAFRLYRNYDGNGSGFGETGIAAGSDDPALVSVYAAQREADGALTVVAINKSADTLSSTITISNFVPAAGAQIFRYSAAEARSIIRDVDLPVDAAGSVIALLPQSLTLVVLPPAATCADVTGDGEITVLDVQAVAGRWRDPAQYDPVFDLHPDGRIDLRDIMTVASRIGTACGP